jgi:hypothetical protein
MYLFSSESRARKPPWHPGSRKQGLKRALRLFVHHSMDSLSFPSGNIVIPKKEATVHILSFY